MYTLLFIKIKIASKNLFILLHSIFQQSLQSKKRSEAQLAEMKNEVNRKNVLLENKDDTISKLTMIKQESDSMACTLKSDAAKYKDDYKRLMNEMTSCIKRLESSENVVSLLKHFCVREKMLRIKAP